MVSLVMLALLSEGVASSGLSFLRDRLPCSPPGRAPLTPTWMPFTRWHGKILPSSLLQPPADCRFKVC